MAKARGRRIGLTRPTSALIWSLQVLADGLVADIIERLDSGEWTWGVDGQTQRLGLGLPGALSHMSGLHRRPDLVFVREALEAAIRKRLSAMTAEEHGRRREIAAARLELRYHEIDRSYMNATAAEGLERTPAGEAQEQCILRVLMKLVRGEPLDTSR